MFVCANGDISFFLTVCNSITTFDIPLIGVVPPLSIIVNCENAGGG